MSVGCTLGKTERIEKIRISSKFFDFTTKAVLCMVLTQVMRERAEAGYLLDAGHNLQLLAAAKLQVAVALVHALTFIA